MVKEIPYGVYTNTICKQLEDIINNGNIGIDRFNDLTGSTPLIKIYLTKNTNVEHVLKYLYKNTSLQYYYGINMTMLDNGRFPRVFTWKETLQAHLEHEKIVYRKAFEYDLKKIEDRLHIVEGIIIALNNIEEVIETIKKSSSTADAKNQLMSKFNLTEVQAKAILDIKLARLARLEVQKYYDEKDELEAKRADILNILNNQTLFYEQIEKGLEVTAKKYGDNRRTQVMNLETTEDDAPIEQKTLIVNLTNKGTLYAYESTTLMTQRRGGKGLRAKLSKDEYIIDSLNDVNSNNLLLFSTTGKVYTILLDNLPLETAIYPQTLFSMEDGEEICNLCSFDKTEANEFIIFTTKNGLVKKSNLSEYKIKKGKGVAAIKLREDDEIINVSFATNEPLGILTKNGNFVIIDTEKINAIGRVTSGVQGIKLNDGDEVVSAHLIPKTTKELLTCSMAALAKKTSIQEYPLATRATKGSFAQKVKDDDHMSCFLPLTGEEKEVIVVSSNGTIKIPVSQIQSSGRLTVGTQLKKLNIKETIHSIIVER